MFQPLKEEKTEDKGPLGLTTLFPGQKRRISHLSKQGTEVRVCSWVQAEAGPRALRSSLMAALADGVPSEGACSPRAVLRCPELGSRAPRKAR